MLKGIERPIVIVAACALINEDGALLIARRPAGRPLAGLWEFPGGKVEAGEEPEDALVRELREELGIEVTKTDLAPLTFASHAYPDFHLLMPVYLCRRFEGHVTALEGQEVPLGEARRAFQLRHAARRRTAQDRFARSSDRLSRGKHNDCQADPIRQGRIPAPRPSNTPCWQASRWPSRSP